MMEKQLPEAATHLIRDYATPIRTFSGASVRGHAIWIATYHDHSADCKTFGYEGEIRNILEAFAKMWGNSLEYPNPDFDKVRIKGEEVTLHGTTVNTSIRVLDGSGYYIAVRFPDEVPSWRARQIVNKLGPRLIQQAAETYNKKTNPN